MIKGKNFLSHVFPDDITGHLVTFIFLTSDDPCEAVVYCIHILIFFSFLCSVRFFQEEKPSNNKNFNLIFCFQVTDIMLQEKLYPGWARPVRNWWKKGWNRIVLFWIVVVITSFVVIFVIATDYIQWDKLNRDFMPTNELSRAFLASFILVMDLLIVMQVIISLLP